MPNFNSSPLDLSDMFQMQRQLMALLGADPTPASQLDGDVDFLKIMSMLIGEVGEVTAPLLISTKPWKSMLPREVREAGAKVGLSLLVPTSLTMELGGTPITNQLSISQSWAEVKEPPHTIVVDHEST